MDWARCVPEDIARSQDAFARRQKVYLAKKGGATTAEIAKALGVSAPRVYQLLASAERTLLLHGPDWSPVMRWLRMETTLSQLTGELNKAMDKRRRAIMRSRKT